MSHAVHVHHSWHSGQRRDGPMIPSRIASEHDRADHGQLAQWIGQSLVDSSIGAGCVANHGLRVGLVANHGSRAKRVSFGGWAMASRAKRVSLVGAPWLPAPKALVAWHGRGERDPQPRRTLHTCTYVHMHACTYMHAQTDGLPRSVIESFTEV